MRAGALPPDRRIRRVVHDGGGHRPQPARGGGGGDDRARAGGDRVSPDAGLLLRLPEAGVLERRGAQAAHAEARGAVVFVPPSRPVPPPGEPVLPPPLVRRAPRVRRVPDVREAAARETFMTEPPHPRAMPRVSIVIPTMNEEASIGRVIDEGRAALGGWDHEILIVDTDSRDRTREIAAKLGARVVDEPRRGYGRAYRTGFDAAKGEIIATLDADLPYPADRIPEFAELVGSGGAAFVSGA